MILSVLCKYSVQSFHPTINGPCPAVHSVRRDQSDPHPLPLAATGGGTRGATRPQRPAPSSRRGWRRDRWRLGLLQPRTNRSSLELLPPLRWPREILPGSRMGTCVTRLTS